MTMVAAPERMATTRVAMRHKPVGGRTLGILMAMFGALSAVFYGVLGWGAYRLFTYVWG